MKTTLVFLSLLFASVVGCQAMDLQRMKVVQTMMDSARTQADLNLASKTLFNIWDDELARKESEVSRTMPKRTSKEFKASMREWRRHIEFMSRMRSELFKQDFMEPKYYRIRGIESKVDGMKRANAMKPYVYNMSRAIYYEEKWVELDVLLNTK